MGNAEGLEWQWILWRQSDGMSRHLQGRADRIGTFGARVEVNPDLVGVDEGEGCPGIGIERISLDCPFKAGPNLLVHFRVRLTPVFTDPQDAFVRRQRLRGAPDGVSQFRLIYNAVRLYQDAGDLRGDVVPQINHVTGVEFLPEAVGPEVLI